MTAFEEIRADVDRKAKRKKWLKKAFIILLVIEAIGVGVAIGVLVFSRVLI